MTLADDTIETEPCIETLRNAIGAPWYERAVASGDALLHVPSCRVGVPVSCGALDDDGGVCPTITLSTGDVFLANEKNFIVLGITGVALWDSLQKLVGATVVAMVLEARECGLGPVVTVPLIVTALRAQANRIDGAEGVK